MQKDFSDLKVGDQVIVWNRYRRCVSKVDGVTPTGLIRVDGELFKPNGSRRGGDSWSRSYLERATPEEVESIRRSETIKKAQILMERVYPTYEQAVKIIETLGGPDDAM